jgi:methyltransferase (TIGR00027 family)
VRTRFYDDYLRTAGCRQVVLLGAGLDARAYRLPWPAGTTVFELDLPPVLALKDRLLGAAPTCTRVPIPVDLRDAWDVPLRAAGFDPGQPTAWLAEGLLVYLERPAAQHVLATLTALSAAGSTIACEGPRSGPAVAQPVGDVARLWHGGLGADLTAELRAHGWTVQVSALADVAREYGRGADATTSTFVVARR